MIALSKANLSFDKNELVFIVGHSNSYKTTLLNLIGGLDVQINQGEVLLDVCILGQDISLENYRKKSYWICLLRI